MVANTAPIFSKMGTIEGGAVLTTAAADYTGVNINNQFIFDADEVNGSFIQKLRFKAMGTNVATVARIYVNNGNLNQTSTIATIVSAPTATTSTTGGTLSTGTYFAKVQPIDQWGGVPAAGLAATLSPESASTFVAGPTGRITWAWTSVPGAASYRIFVGAQANGQYAYFRHDSTVPSFTQTSATQVIGTDIRLGNPNDYYTNQMFIGEVSLPATTASASSATPDIEYSLNMALPPGYRILVGLGTTVAAGWAVTGIGGNY
jgi:hypothetical protein